MNEDNDRNLDIKITYWIYIVLLTIGLVQYFLGNKNLLDTMVYIGLLCIGLIGSEIFGYFYYKRKDK
ncbi:hypothetical protein CVD28_02380 [Bacillus sp. M6-12]|uniref:hypothetical protein n=1 Tax=Bacillus sp. M6-12 TaxID=2054166 RepID=UPI000C794584|nr:hypothetical protein [Bacillus sp. M6-12]PLS19279.1 hypothetical protein CVD28_02380 [Bacillus sp. M6-12]